MRQERETIHLESSLGYLVKETSSALRTAMELALRPLNLTITHYSCLELLAQRPGLSNSDLARGAFVTRQSMLVVLQNLEASGLISRSERPTSGRALPVELTGDGRALLKQASAAVKDVENRMTRSLSSSEQSQLRDLLTRCGQSLRAG